VLPDDTIAPAEELTLEVEGGGRLGDVLYRGGMDLFLLQLELSEISTEIQYASCLHGAQGLVQQVGMIALDVDKRTIDMQVSDEELARRRAAWKKPEPRYERGYGWMFTRHIKQANDGCDFDFLETAFGAPVGEPSIY